MINWPIGPQDSAMGFRASAVGFCSVRPQGPTMSLRASASGSAKAVDLRHPRIADLLPGSLPQRAETMLEHPRSPRAPSSGYLHIPEQCWHLISLLAERPLPHQPETPASRPGGDRVRAFHRTCLLAWCHQCWINISGFTDIMLKPSIVHVCIADS